MSMNWRTIQISFIISCNKNLFTLRPVAPPTIIHHSSYAKLKLSSAKSNLDLLTEIHVSWCLSVFNFHPNTDLGNILVIYFMADKDRKPTVNILELEEKLRNMFESKAHISPHTLLESL